MGYLHIDNLYKGKEVLLFKEVFCMEKIHGTSAHIGWSVENQCIHFFSGGEKHDSFVSLFDKDFLQAKFIELFGLDSVTIFGEAYGGKCQGMSDTYGKQLKFVAFDVKVGGVWLSVENAHDVCSKFNIEFVDYVKCFTDQDQLDKERDRESIQAIRNGCGYGKKREGIIIRPLIELTKNNGERLIAKYKQDEFKETKTARLISEEEQKVLDNALEIAKEWVVPMRLEHVLDKIEGWNDMSKTPVVIKAMIEDIEREAAGEIVMSKEARTSIGRETAILFKKKVQLIET